MIWIDYTIISLILISAIMGLLRGFTKEFIALGTWVTSTWVASTFNQKLVDALQPVLQNDFVKNNLAIIQHHSAQVFIAFVFLFMATFVLGRLLGYLSSTFINTVGLTIPDRLAGMIFGAGRGLITVLIALMLAELIPAELMPDSQNTWQESFVVAYFQPWIAWLHDYMGSGETDFMLLKYIPSD